MSAPSAFVRYASAALLGHPEPQRRISLFGVIGNRRGLRTRTAAAGDPSFVSSASTPLCPMRSPLNRTRDSSTRVGMTMERGAQIGHVPLDGLVRMTRGGCGADWTWCIGQAISVDPARNVGSLISAAHPPAQSHVTIQGTTHTSEGNPRVRNRTLFYWGG